MLGDSGAGRFRCWEIQVLGDLDLTSRLLSVILWGSVIQPAERIKNGTEL